MVISGTATQLCQSLQVILNALLKPLAGSERALFSSTNAAINIISESEKQGANSLTPTCIHDDDTAVCDALGNGHLLPYFDVAAARLKEQNPGIIVNASNVFNFMSA
jgi:hypothetical protein